jgi:beta-lactam-binding protein with PASTA domain
MDPLDAAGRTSEPLHVPSGRPFVATALAGALLASIVTSLGLGRAVLAQEFVTTTEVPNIVGLTQDKADSAIQRAGLTVDDVRAVADEAPRGTVVAQSPPGGTQVELGSPVSYAVSAGTTPGPRITPAPPVLTPVPTLLRVLVPDVRGMPEADAARLIRTAGLVVDERRNRPNETVAAGTAIRTDPAAGTALEAGSGVILIISQGPPLATVPDLVGRRQGPARRAIADAGLVVGEATSLESRELANTILAQDPPAGSRVRPGSAVSYTFSAGPPTTLVPQVRGLTLPDAIAAIEAAGLLVSTTETSPDASVPPGDAVGTDPEAGAIVEVGSGVVLALSASQIGAGDAGLPPESVVVAVLLALILLAGLGAIGAARLARGPHRPVPEPQVRVPTIRTVSHPDPAPRIRIRGGGR